MPAIGTNYFQSKMHNMVSPGPFIPGLIILPFLFPFPLLKPHFPVMDQQKFNLPHGVFEEWVTSSAPPGSLYFIASVI